MVTIIRPVINLSRRTLTHYLDLHSRVRNTHHSSFSQMYQHCQRAEWQQVAPSDGWFIYFVHYSWWATVIINVHTKWENDEDEQQNRCICKAPNVCCCFLLGHIVNHSTGCRALGEHRHLLVLVFEKTQHQNDTFLFLALFNLPNFVFREHHSHIMTLYYSISGYWNKMIC